MNDGLRTLLAQARLHVRRAQLSIEREPRPLRYLASEECDKACALIDHVLRKTDGDETPTEQSTPREDFDVMAAVEDWQRLVDDARREELVPP